MYQTTQMVLQEPTKRQIIERLFKADVISFDEMWTLILDDPNEKHYIPVHFQYPDTATDYTYKYTNGTDTPTGVDPFTTAGS